MPLGECQLANLNLAESKIRLTLSRRFSDLSTSNSILSPLSRTFSMLSTMIFFTSSTCQCLQSDKYLPYRGHMRHALIPIYDFLVVEWKFTVKPCASVISSKIIYKHYLQAFYIMTKLTLFCTAATFVSSSGCAMQNSICSLSFGLNQNGLCFKLWCRQSASIDLKVMRKGVRCSLHMQLQASSLRLGYRQWQQKDDWEAYPKVLSRLCAGADLLLSAQFFWKSSLTRSRNA